MSQGRPLQAKRTSRIATEAAVSRDTALSFVHLSEEEFAGGRSSLVRPVEEDSIDLLALFGEAASPERNDSTSDVSTSDQEGR